MPVLAATAPTPTVAAPTPAIPAPNPAAQAFVDQLAVSGVLLGNSQRILVKTQAYDLGVTVNRDLKLKLVAVLPHDIIFADESGFQYHKRY